MVNIDAPKQIDRTICEVHREIYRELNARNPHDYLIPILREAFDMGKKMDNKLRQYARGYDEGWWEQNRLVGGEIEDESDG